ncbi:mitochondrial carrier domain-containing protein [Pelagophyceae sp. CCMP2097]|nr:mitochondrial carrier domain-containing protein [Pelagophyceae sp. CCMP2097]
MAGRYDVLQRLDEVENTVLGTFAGVAAAVSTQPGTYFKNCAQQRVPISFDPRVMYRGTGASCLCDATMCSVQFLACGFLQKAITNGEPRKMTCAEEIGCALAGGLCSGLPTCVLELVMIRQQLTGLGPIDAVRSIVHVSGPRGMLRGLGPATCRESLFAAGYLGLSPRVQRTCEAAEMAPLWTNVASAVVSGTVCGILTHPIDTVKSCLQGDVERKHYTDVASTARTLWRQQGLRAFYRGMVSRTAVICCCFFIFNETKLQLSEVLFPSRFHSEEDEPPAR